MADEVTYPVAYCATCDDKGPVVVSEFPSEDLGTTFVAIYCPGCENVINLTSDVRVEWFKAEDIAEITGWRIVNDGK